MPASDTNVSHLSTASTHQNSSNTPPDVDSEPNDRRMSLHMDFTTPLTGDARNMRLQQMKQIHPSMPQIRHIQELLHSVQTSLRRIPGICAQEAQQMVSDLQEVSQLVSTEAGQMLDCIVNMQLDVDFNHGDFARMSVNAVIEKAQLERATQRVVELETELEEVKTAASQERDKLAKEKGQIKDDLKMMSEEFGQFREKVRQSSGSPDSQDHLVKNFEELLQHLEDQVNNRRSLWILRHNDPDMIAKAFNTMRDSITDKAILQKSLNDLVVTGNSFTSSTSGPVVKANGPNGHQGQRTPNGLNSTFIAPGTPFAHQTEFNHHPSRALTAFQHMDRPQSTRPRSGFSPLQAGPPRAPSARPPGRPFSAWAPNGGASRTISMNQSLASPGFNRPASRRGYQGQRFRADGFGSHTLVEHTPPRPGTGFGHREQPGYTQTLGFARCRGRAMIQGAFESQAAHNEVSGNELMRGVNGTALIHLTERAVAGWSERMDELYACIRSFVDDHASDTFGPEPHGLENSKAWTVLVACYAPLKEQEAASFMEHHLREYNSKKCLVTRLVVDYIVNCVWTVFAWKGFDADTDRAIDQLWYDLARTEGQPSHMRQPLLDRQANLVDSIMKHPQPLAAFRDHSIARIATTLITNLEPVFDADASPEAAYASLLVVAEKAWELSSRILTSRLTFDFRFPEVGSRFSCQSMVPVWPADTDPMELQAKHWRVAMVTTPVVTCRNDTGTNISAHSVSLADVICMQ